MTTHRLSLGLWLTTVLWTAVVIPSCCLSSEYADNNLVQRAQYHLTELEKTLRELDTSHRLHKRHAERVPNQCPDLLTLVHQMCDRKNSETHGTQKINPITTAVQDSKNGNTGCSGAPPFDLAFYRNSTPPGIILSKAKAKRHGNDVKVELEIIHSSEIYILQRRSFNTERTVMDSTEDLGTCHGNISKKLSRVALTFDVSKCWRDDARDEVSISIAPYEKTRSFADVTLDICKFDKVYNNSEWQKKTGKNLEYSQVLETPMFKIVPDPGDRIFIERRTLSNRENTSIELEMRIGRGMASFLSYYFWDWQEGKSESQWIAISRDTEAESGVKVHNFGMEEAEEFRASSLLQVDILSAVVSNDVDEGKDEDDREVVDVKLRVTLTFGSRELSGRLEISQKWDEDDWEKRPIVRDFTTYRSLILQLPYKVSEWPAGEVTFYAHNRQCDEDGNKYMEKYGKSCTIDCHAFGSNIKSIFMTRSPYKAPVKSSSFVLNHVSAYVIQDVGPASQDNEGEYQCTVVLQNGQTKSKRLTLQTSRFTKMTNFTLEDLGNSTALLECTVYGVQPLNITMHVASENYTQVRIDDKKGAVRSVEALDDDITILTVLISVVELQYPMGNEVYCEATGEGGSDQMLVISSLYLNEYNSFVPKLVKENSTIVLGTQEEDIAKVFCLANTNGHPVDMMVSFGGRAERFRIDYNMRNIRQEEETDDGTLLTLTVRKSSITRSTSWLYCGAVNEYGEDWIDFYLPHYGIDD